MAVVRCKLEQDGKLKVVEVIAFEDGDRIELEEHVEVLWQIPGSPTHVTSKSKCLAVVTTFSANGRATENVIPVPCPGN
jgi:hypothetical protein